MDLLMPEMNGFEATAKIRALENERCLSREDRHYVCGISGDLTEHVKNRCKASGMNNIVPKPIKKALL